MGPHSTTTPKKKRKKEDIASIHLKGDQSDGTDIGDKKKKRKHKEYPIHPENLKTDADSGKHNVTLAKKMTKKIMKPNQHLGKGFKKDKPSNLLKTEKSFNFVEVLDEHWEAIIQEVRFRAFTHTSSFVGNVKYDQDEQMMEIILNGVKTYEFCQVPERVYDAFEGANSKGAYFNRNIRTQFDC